MNSAFDAGAANLAPTPGEKPVAPVAPVVPRPIVEAIKSSDWRRRRTYPTGFDDLDERLAGGVKSRQLTVICAPTGSGKTGLASTIALNIARVGTPVVWAAGELDEAEQSARLAAIAIRDSGRGSLTADQILSEERPSPLVEQSIDGLPIYVIDFDGSPVDPIELIEKVGAFVADRHGVRPVVVVDYLQTLATEGLDNLHVSTSAVARRLRRLAKSLDVAIVAISSVSRAYYGISGKDRKLKVGAVESPRDWLAAAKESGDIEFAAGVVTYLDTADEFDSAGEAPARLIVAKSRQGTVGFIGLRFHGPSGRFVACAASVRAMAPQSSSPADDDEIVAGYVRRQATSGKPATRATMKAGLAGLSHERKLSALQRLIDDGLVEEVSEVRTNNRGSDRSVRVLRWVGSSLGANDG